MSQAVPADDALIKTNDGSSGVLWTDAAVVAAATSVLFLVLYTGTAMITEMRAVANPDSIGTWYYAWERFIPFVPILIIPYMSIDAFFVLAPFTCRDRAELAILGKRLAAVVVIAAICFLLWPLQLAVPRPVATGPFGGIYNWFVSVDRPYNLCPSMHIALRTVLAAHYGKHTRGVVRLAMNVWFFLIGCSTLLLYQHHVIDVVGGFVLALLVMYAIDGLPWRQTKVGGAKFAWMYGGVSVLLLIPMLLNPALLNPALGWIVLWPSLASCLVAIGYAWAGPAVYRRQNGKLSWPSRIVLGPVLAAQWLSWKHYGRQANAIDHVVGGVFIGRLLTDDEAREVTQEKVHAVIDVCNAFDEPESLCKITRLEPPVLDLTAPSRKQLDQAVDFIERHRDRGVLVHCKAGYSRSAAIVAAWLVRTGRAKNSEQAFAIIRAVRPSIVVRPEIRSLDLAEANDA